MSELSDNEYGVEFVYYNIRKLRIFRTDGKWLVEYQREPRWIFGLDRWWWFDDSTYLDYADASARVDHLLGVGYVRKAQFQKVKVFEFE